jgi:subtilisin-like proprotein convertase family protein
MKKKPASQSAFFNPRVLIGALCLVGALGALFAFHAMPGASALAQQEPEQNQTPVAAHKVSVSDPQLVQTLKSQGARVIADYGSFVLLEANDKMAGLVVNNRNAQIVDENNLVLLNAGTIDTRTPEAQALRSAISTKSGNQMRLIQFAGPIRPEWYQSLVATGAHIVTYIPNNAYLVYGPAQTLQRVHTLAANRSVAQWDGEYTAAHRVDPAITAASNGKPINLSARGNEQFTIQMVEDPAENVTTLALIEQLKLEPIISQEKVLGYVNVTVALPRAAVINRIAERGDVVSIQQWVNPIVMCERQDMIMAGNLTGNSPTPGDYLAYLTGKGFNVNTASSFGVNVSDSGLDNGTTTPAQFLLYTSGDSTNPANSRVSYVALQGTATAADAQGCHGHGNINTTIIGGYVPTGTVSGVNFGAFPHADASGFRWGLGIAPFVKVGMSVIFNTAGTFTNPVIPTLESNAYAAGMRISSNSWGSAVNGAYNSTSQTYDALVRDAQAGTAGNQEYTIVFSAGNNGATAQTIGSPGTGKNVITVGAAEDVNPFGGSDGCGTPDSGANSANDIIAFSSRGPTTDGRKKPDIMGPGTHVSGGAPQAAIVTPPGSGNGVQLPCFNGSGVCGGVGSIFFPAGQQYYTASSGTSHSCPAVAGAAALIRQHFINQGMTPPSPAMVKGLMMNSARYMNGVGANDTLPSNNQGMGETSFNSYFDIFATPRSLHDEVAGDLFTASGQFRVITGNVADNAKPLRVTLAWTDVPGPTSGNAFVNNLDLEVTVGGNTYKGNNFTGAFSSTGGTADTRNNVESVFIPAGVTGNVVVKVKATNIAGDGVPGNGQPLDQDYALVVYNITEVPTAAVASGTTAVTSESCAPGNSAVDPGETVTLDFSLFDVGTANTTSLVATLQPTGGVTLPSGPQNYGVLVASGPAVARPFTFTAVATCGTPITATLQLQDGAANLGTVTFTIPVGGLGAALTPVVYSSTGGPFPIPDLGSVDIPIVVNDVGAASDVNVRVRLDHTLDNNLQLSIVSPGGTSILLANNRGGAAGANFGSGTNDCSGNFTIFNDSAAAPITTATAPFVGNFRPEVPLTGLINAAVNGTWTLHIVDTVASNTGTVGCVQLEITRKPYVCCDTTIVPTPTPSPTPTPTPSPTPTPTPTPSPSPTPPSQATNLSTRMKVLTGDNVAIGGFIITGTVPKPVLLRAIGPSLTAFGVPGALADPVLELHGPSGFTTITDDNWRDDPVQQALIIATGIPPSDNLESAIVATLAPGNYTGIVSGKNNTTGVALIEVYDLSPSVLEKLGNISTRAFVDIGDNVVIAGFILGNSPGNDNVIIRGIGPSLALVGVPNVLANPTLEVHNNSGTLVASNDNWQDDPSQAAILNAAGLGLNDASESGIAATLGPGLYTAILAGQGNGTGVGLVEVYDRGNAGGGGASPTPGTPSPTPTPGTPPPGTPTPTPPPATPTPTPPPASPTPSPSGPCVENFDGATAPALPPGFVASNPTLGDGVLWVTETTTPDAGPNDAFIPDQDGVSDKVLDSRSIVINSASAVITFRNNYNTEYDPPPAETFWDGGVLEVSSPNIAGGAFTDVTDPAVGGTITAGDYTGEIDGTAGNPLAGRRAWCGNSGGYINTAINLGPNVNGQTIKLRFRMGSDEAAARPGWRVDTISITNASCP